jgi:protein arginine kinase
LSGLCDIAAINELLILTQPAHIQKLTGREMASAERNVMRAEIVHEKLRTKQ